MRKIFIRYLRMVLNWRYIGKCVAILILLQIHEYAKYPTNNRFNVFYWPEGICLDTFAVIGVLILAVWLIWDQFRFWVKNATLGR